ncbi:hypothetical protein [Streptomyces fungicidicus]|uniref:hypothetical protein n=1 Tax=Streptomyces fungicidicus TaxID=68203 RepID=UPI003D723D5B
MPHTAAPTVSWSVAPDRRPGTPLVVALHGRGADEASFAQLAPRLPAEASVACCSPVRSGSPPPSCCPAPCRGTRGCPRSGAA